MSGLLFFIRRAVAYANRRRREIGPLLRGYRILRRYSAHYASAAAIYRRETGRLGPPPCGPLEGVGVRVVSGDGGELGLSLPPDFGTKVRRVAAGAAAALDRAGDCDFFPPVNRGALPESSADLLEVTNGQVITIKLRDPLGIDGVAGLCEPLLEQLERSLYGCFLMVDKVYVYRSLVCRQPPAGAWLWHFDNHPREMLKVLIYLTDVDEDTAPFEYLLDGATGRTQLGRPLAPLHGDSRVPPAYIEQQIAQGWQLRRVCGPAGTVILLDDNVIHRATLPRRAPRDVIVFQIRPSLFRASPRVDPRWTGSFPHRNFNPDPWLTDPVLRGRPATA